MSENAKEVTAEYVRQIIAACRDSDSAEFMVTELLKEFGAKAYRQGRQHLAAEVTKLA
jgi:ribosomal protein S24E